MKSAAHATESAAESATKSATTSATELVTPSAAEPATPPTPDPTTFHCPSCGEACAWRPEIVGKVAQCSCGEVFKVPPLNAPDDATPFTPIPHVPAPPRRRKSLDEAGPLPTAEDCHDADAFDPDALDPDTEAELAATARYGEADPSRPDPFRDRHAPLLLIAVGLLLLLAEVAYHVRAGTSLASTLAFLLVGLVIQLAMMLGGLLAAARFAGLHFGPLNTALLKLFAIYLAPSTLGALLTEALGGDLAVASLGWGVTVGLYWILLSYLFRLDGSQTATCVFAISAVRFVTKSLLLGLFLSSLSVPASPEELAADAEPELHDTESASLSADADY